jgi:phosphoribosylformimino-5-aminoimidazole carboxamide ribotide isomerase
MFLPAIDLMNGRCVRLEQGEKQQKTEYAGDPAAVARSFGEDGADAIHVVDLDGAFEGKRRNMAVIMAITAAAGIPVEAGGGIRTLEDMDALFEAGVWRVVLGTAAVKNPPLVSDAVRAFGAEKVALGIDVKQGKAAVRGWTEKTEISAEALALDMKQRGIRTVIYTEISRDSMLLGPDIEAAVALAKATGLEVVASGGIGSIDDVRRLLDREKAGIAGFITGKAVYEGRLSVKETALLVHGSRGETNVKV